MGPKKGVKLSLGSFLADETFGSWADDMVEDLPPIPSSMGNDRYGNSSNDRYGDRADRGERFGSGAPDRYVPPSRQERPERDFNDLSRGSKFESSEPLRDGPRDEYRRQEREPLPIPDEPPFTAFIGNLANEAVDEDLTAFFDGFPIKTVRVIRDRMEQPKGFAYVEFEDREALEKALDRTGEEILNRPVRINVADSPKDDRTTGEWRKKPSDGKVRDFGNWERRGPLPVPVEDRRTSFGSRSSSGSRSNRDSAEPENPRSFDNWRGPRNPEPERMFRRGRTPEQNDGADQRPAPTERKRLALKPRTVPVEAAAAPAPAPVTKSKSNPFGGAAPVDTAKKLAEIEQRLAQKEAERRQKQADEAKEREEREAAAAAAAKAAAEETDRAIMAHRKTGDHAPSAIAAASPAPVEEKKEESPAPAPPKKTFDVLRTAAAADDDFIPDDEDEEAAAEEEKKETVEETPVQQAADEAADGDDWSVVSKPAKRTNGK
ncbi:hypothetical protein BZA70DRAFT_276096 [Myxozyma melibiosi]|uniref:RRM domain-containing protein n=1 Tax=Myxozyma melibiosi TaxID=54550 RepID=A0ABR1F8Q8_9ASCO